MKPVSILVACVVFSVPAPRVFADDYEKKVENQIEAISHKIEYWQSHSEKVGVQTRQELQNNIDSLQRKVAEARKKLNALESSSQDKWKPLKRNLEQTMDELRRTYHKTTNHFHP